VTVAITVEHNEARLAGTLAILDAVPDLVFIEQNRAVRRVHDEQALLVVRRRVHAVVGDEFERVNRGRRRISLDAGEDHFARL